MAHGPNARIQVLALALTGVSLRAIVRRTGVPKSTASRWTIAALDGENGTAFHAGTEPLALLDALVWTELRILQAWAEVAGSPAFVRARPRAALSLGLYVLDRIDRMTTRLDAARATENY